MTEDLLRHYLFTIERDSFWVLEFANGAMLWFLEGKMYIATIDTPNQYYAIPVRCNDEQDLKEIINILTRK